MVWRCPLPRARSRAWVAAGAASVLAALGSSCAIQGRRPPTPDAATQAFARPAIEALSTEQALIELAAYEEGKSNRALLAIEARVARGSADGEAYGQLLDRLAALLSDPGVRVAAKRFVCRQLSVGGHDRHVAALAALLNDPDLSHMARYALGRIPGPAAGEALRAALDTVRGPLLVGVVNTLGERGEAQAADRLETLLADPEIEVAGAAARALGSIGTFQAVERLSSASETARLPLQEVIQDSLLAGAERLLARGETGMAVSVCSRLAAPGQPAHVRAAALGTLVAATGEQSVPLVVRLLAEEDPAMRAAAAAYIRDLPGRDVTVRLTELLDPLGPAGQVLLLNALAERGDDVARDAVTRLATNEDAEVRVAAVIALRRLGDASTVPLLAGLSASRHQATRQAARESLARLRGDAVDAAILSTTRAAQGPALPALISVLAERRSPGAVPLLLLASQSTETAVRIEALKALGVLSGQDQVPDLVGLLLQSQDAAELDVAARSAVAAIQSGPEPTRRTAVVVAALGEAVGPARMALLRMLGRVGGEEALAAVRASLADPDPDVGAAALRVLADWPDAGAMPDLLGLARTAPDQVSRILALRGYVRMLGLPSGRSAAEAVGLYHAAMAAAERREERRLVLGAVGQTENEALLNWAADYVADSELSAEATAAVLGLATRIGPKDRAGPEAAIRRALALATTDQLKADCRSALAALSAFDGYLTSWLLAGPFFQEKTQGRDLLDIEFAPERGDPLAAWRVVRNAGNDPAVNWGLDLSKAVGGDNRTAYLRAWVRVSHPRKAELQLGSDDGIKAWLNGEVVHSKKVDRGMRRAEDIVPVVLRAGWNEVMLKVTQGGGGWGACARFWAADDGPIDDMTQMHAEDAVALAQADLDGWDPLAVEAAARFLADWLAPEAAARLLTPALGRATAAPRVAGVLVDLALRHLDSRPDLAGQWLLLAMPQATEEGVRRRAVDGLTRLRGYEEYIDRWLVSAPYSQEGVDAAALFDLAFAPEDAHRRKDVPWRVVRCDQAGGPSWYLDLERLVGGTRCVAYLRTGVWSPSAQSATLELGSDDGAKVWLNGMLVLATNRARALQRGEDTVAVHLVEGWNSLLVKVIQGDGHWAACVRFRAADGGPSGLRVRLSAFGEALALAARGR